MKRVFVGVNGGARHGMPIRLRFWLKVETGYGCWLWTGSKSQSGYGRIAVNEPGAPKKDAQAHRLSWELHYGPIPEGFVVCHSCDTPACVRPDHLFLGTQQDNVADMMRKGRGRFGFVQGEDHPASRTTAADVVEIRRRRAEGETLRALSRAFDLSESQINRIANGESWSHIPMDEGAL